jgi:hypothetical protein
LATTQILAHQLRARAGQQIIYSFALVFLYAVLSHARTSSDFLLGILIDLYSGLQLKRQAFNAKQIKIDSVSRGPIA